jgi:hypothetical protein
MLLTVAAALQQTSSDGCSMCVVLRKQVAEKVFVDLRGSISELCETLGEAPEQQWTDLSKVLYYSTLFYTMYITHIVQSYSGKILQKYTSTAHYRTLCKYTAYTLEVKCGGAQQ